MTARCAQSTAPASDTLRYPKDPVQGFETTIARERRVPEQLNRIKSPILKRQYSYSQRGTHIPVYCWTGGVPQASGVDMFVHTLLGWYIDVICRTRTTVTFCTAIS